MTDAGTPRSLPHGPVEVSFEDRGTHQVIRWQAGCNTVGGTFDIGPDRLLPDPATPFGGTAMDCGDEARELDAWLRDVFAAGPSWRLRGDTLVLTTGDVRIELAAR